MAKNFAPRADLYAQTTDKIIAAMESGTVPWRRPWNLEGSLKSGQQTSAPPSRKRHPAPTLLPAAL